MSEMMYFDREIRSRTVISKSGTVKMEVSYYEKKKLIEQTVMSIEDYITLLEKTKRREETIPNVACENVNFLYKGFVSTQKGTCGGIFVIPPRQHQFVLNSTTVPTPRERKGYYLPMPGLIYFVTFNNGVKSNMKCYAYKKDEFDGEKTPLYYYPFGNVSSSGAVCMGNIEASEVLCLSDILLYIEDSLNGETNNDYLQDGKVRLSINASQHEFCDSITDTSVFPEEYLLSTEKELGELVSSLQTYLKK